MDNLRELVEHLKQQVPGAGGDAKNAQEEDGDVPEFVEGEILKIPQKIIVLFRQILLKERSVLCCFILPSVASYKFYDFDTS